MKKIYLIFVIFTLSFILSFGWLFIYNKYYYSMLKIEIRWNLAYKFWTDKLFNWVYTIYYDKLKSKFESQEYKNWKKYGKNYKYYIDGKISSESNYVDWVLSWSLIVYNEDWNIIQKNTYSSWILFWTWYYYYPNWKILAVENYSWGIVYWEKKTYYEDNKLKIVQKFDNWKLNWQELLYSNSWIILQDFLYDNDKMIDWKMYDENWVLLSHIVFDKNSWKNILKEYDEDWNIINIQELENFSFTKDNVLK